MPRKSKVIVVPIEEKTDAELMTELVNEIQTEAEPEAETKAEPEPEAETKQTKVSCPDCGKQMSAKTLKYSHAPNCLKKQEPTVVSEELIEQEVKKRLNQTKVDRITRKQEAVNKLVANAFP